jgi:hypothetical protein
MLKNIYKIAIASVIAFALFFLQVKTATDVATFEEVEPEEVFELLSEIIEEIPVLEKLRPELFKICTCESGQGTGKPQHYNVKTGEVIRGFVNSDDIGMCQINRKYHERTAEGMGLDIFTEQGNIRYANWLYAQQGSQPWNWSRSCWDR